MASINERLRRLEGRRGLDRERRICSECGAQDGGVIITETHHEDSSVTFYPHPPCSGCDELWPLGAIRRIVIHMHDCPVCSKKQEEEA